MSAPTPLVPNPGGTLTASQVLGRDALIASLWDTLRQQSVVLLAPRRMGKSSVCRKMHAELHPGFTRGSAVVRDLEGRRSAGELVELLFEDAAVLLTPATLAKTRAGKLWQATIGKVEFKGVSFSLPKGSWVSLLELILAELNAYGEKNGTLVVLFWDEFPYFLDDVRSKKSAQEATQLLDLLRAARQRHASLRMVLTGSIGLHEVIDALRAEGYGGDPTNDMATVEVPLLTGAGAREVATALLAGAGVSAKAQAAMASPLVTLCEGHPFLMQHVAKGIKLSGDDSVSGMQRTLTALIDDAQDPLHLQHYLKRLGQLYGAEREALALGILDAIAKSDEGMRQRELVDATGGADLEAIRDLLQGLRRDHYIERDGDRRYHFRLGFLRRYWRMERDL